MHSCTKKGIIVEEGFVLSFDKMETKCYTRLRAAIKGRSFFEESAGRC
jgi:hypothetical protein